MICTYLNWVRIHWFEQIHKLNDLLISSFYFSVEITDFHRYEVKIEFLLRLWLVLYSPQPVLGSYFSIKWNNGTLQEEYWQQLPNTKTDTDREKGGSPGFEKYPHALPAMCLLAKLQLFWVSNQYFQWKHKWVWLRGRGAKSVRYIRKLLALRFKIQYKQTKAQFHKKQSKTRTFGPHTPLRPWRLIRISRKKLIKL